MARDLSEATNLSPGPTAARVRSDKVTEPASRLLAPLPPWLLPQEKLTWATHVWEGQTGRSIMGPAHQQPLFAKGNALCQRGCKKAPNAADPQERRHVPTFSLWAQV